MRSIAVMAACLGLLLGGCYEVDKPIITHDIAVDVPGLEGDVRDRNRDAYLVFSFDEQSMSYRYGTREPDGSIEWEPGALLAMPLRDEFYWFQFPQEDGQGFKLYLVKFERAAKRLSHPYVPAMTDDEFRQFTEQYRVTVTGTGKFGRILLGSRDDILAFLKEHADVPVEKLEVRK